MNLHSIVGPVVAAINPWVIGAYQRSLGSVQQTDYSRKPSYAKAVNVQIQMQALSFRDLTQIQGLNQNGEKRAMYISARWEGVSRPESRGGDIVTLPCGTVWLVAQVLENWHQTDGWCKVAVVRQMPVFAQ